MIVAGADKASMAAKALTGIVDPKAVPAQLARRAHWILDAAAASALEK